LLSGVAGARRPPGHNVAAEAAPRLPRAGGAAGGADVGVVPGWGRFGETEPRHGRAQRIESAPKIGQ